MPGTEVAKRTQQQIAALKFPPALGEFINGHAWANAILTGAKYTEPDPEFISRKLALDAIMAGSVEEVFQNAGILKVQEMVPDSPGASSPPFEVTDLYVAESDYETGNPTYVIIEGTWLNSGNTFKCHTGATNIQATLIGLLANNAWPIRAKFKRGESKDRGGRYLLFLMPPD